MALVVRVEVADEQEGHAGVGGEGLEQFGVRLQPAGGGPDADDRERHPGRTLVGRGGGVGQQFGGHSDLCEVDRAGRPRRVREGKGHCRRARPARARPPLTP